METSRIRCYARVRPTWEYERAAKRCIEVDQDVIRLSRGGKLFEFDRIFDSDSSQTTVFNDVAKDLIDNAFAGYHGTLLVYGQTGTGKTYTITNREADGLGMIPQGMQYIFDRIAREPEKQYHVSFDYVQLYRDNIEDLMSPLPRTEKDDGGPPRLRRIDMRREDTGGVDTLVMKDLKNVEVTSLEHFYRMYDIGCANKAMAETSMNKNSSRGHALLIVHLRTERPPTETEGGAGVSADELESSGSLHGKIIFADLAGYERIKKSMTSGVRKDEAASINLSLNALANVIHALTNKATFVSWRASKLTRLLQDSLGGNSLTGVIVTLNALSEHITETINTLYFGYNAMQCKTTKRIDTGPVDYKSHYIRLQAAYKILDAEKRRLEEENAALLKGGATSSGAAPKSRADDKEVEGYINMIDEMRMELEASEAKAEAQQKRINELSTTLDEKELEEAQFEEEVEKSLEALHAELEAKEEKLKGAEGDLEEIAEEMEVCMAENEELLAAKSSNEATIKALEATAKHRDPELVGKLTTLEQELGKLRREKEEVQRQLQEMEKQLESAKQQAATPVETGTGADETPSAVAGQTGSAPGDENLTMQDGTRKCGVHAEGGAFSLDTLLEQFTTPGGDSDDDETIMTAVTEDPSHAQARAHAKAEAGMRELANSTAADEPELDELSELEDDSSSEGAGPRAPEVRWVSWDRNDEPRSYQQWWKVLEEIQGSDKTSYHTTMKDVNAFLTSEYTPQEDTPPAPATVSVAPTSPAGKNTILAAAAAKLGEGDTLWVNAPDVTDKARRDPEFPRVKEMTLNGKWQVDSMLSAKATYSGGTEGPSRRRWYRVWKDKATGEEFSESICKDKMLYRVTEQDVNCFIVFEYVPIRKDSTVGPAVICRSPTPVQPGQPTVTNIRIEGECLAMRSLWVSYKFRGGEEGASIVRWFKSLDGYTFFEINRPRPGSGKKNDTLCLGADLVHHYIRVLVVPVTQDGVRGRPSNSKLVYINVDAGLDKSLKDMILQGTVGFNVRINDGKASQQDLVVHLDGKKFRVSRGKGKAAAAVDKHQEIFALPWSNNMQIFASQGSETKFVLKENYKSRVTRLIFSVQQRNERDIVILAFRAFSAMSRSLVCQIVVGESYVKDWRKGKWKAMPLEKRSTVFSRQLANPGPVFEKYTCRHRPGSSRTFLHLLEETLIEYELDTHGTKGGMQLPFPLE